MTGTNKTGETVMNETTLTTNYEFFIHAQSFGGFWEIDPWNMTGWTVRADGSHRLSHPSYRIRVYDPQLVRDAEGEASHYIFQIDQEGYEGFEVKLTLNGYTHWCKSLEKLY